MIQLLVGFWFDWMFCLFTSLFEHALRSSLQMTGRLSPIFWPWLRATVMHANATWTKQTKRNEKLKIQSITHHYIRATRPSTHLTTHYSTPRPIFLTLISLPIYLHIAKDRPWRDSAVLVQYHEQWERIITASSKEIKNRSHHELVSRRGPFVGILHRHSTDPSNPHWKLESLPRW